MNEVYLPEITSLQQNPTVFREIQSFLDLLTGRGHGSVSIYIPICSKGRKKENTFS